MLKNIIVLSDGTELSSGTTQGNALQSVAVTQCVNDGEELTLGSVCSQMLEATLFAPEGNLNIAAGSEVALYCMDEGGARTKVGIFILEKPTRASANTYHIIAYDYVSRLDKDMTDWLAGLTQWPYPLLSFAKMVCQACGLQLMNQEIPNGDFLVHTFSGTGITGRSLMQWVGEASGRFCRANADGTVELSWYTPAQISLQSGGENFYYLDTLRYEDYRITPIDKLQIRLTDADMGVSVGTGDNVYTITGNYLLASDSAGRLQSAAQVLFDILKEVVYTPCSVTIPATLAIQAGDILQITDSNGVPFSMYIMTKVLSGQRETLECTGSVRRDSSTVVNNSHMEALNGRVLELQVDLEGVQIENRNMQGEIASLTLKTDGNISAISAVSGQVGALENRTTLAEAAITQNTNQIQMSVTRQEETEKRLVSAVDSEASLVRFEAVEDTGIFPAVHIKAVQEGTGDPSQDNVRPISGVDTVGVTVCGKNLYNLKDFLAPHGTSSRTATGITATKVREATYSRIRFLVPSVMFTAGKKYTISYMADTWVQRVSVGEANDINDTSTYQKYLNKSIANDSEVTFTITDITKPCIYIQVDFQNVEVGVSYALANIQIEEGSTATAYESYSEQTETVNLPAISYGGYVDWARGKYVQTYGGVVLDGTEAITLLNGSVCQFSVGAGHQTKENTAPISSHYRGETRYSANFPKPYLRVRTDIIAFEYGAEETTITTVDALRSFLSAQHANGTPVTVVYELATPIAHDLGILPALIARDGLNNVFHNGNGGIDLSYNHDNALGYNIGRVQTAAEKNAGQIENIREGMTATDERIAGLTVRQSDIAASVAHTATQVNNTNRNVEALERRVDATMTEEAVKLLVSQSRAQGVQRVVTSTGYIFDETGFTVEKSGKVMKTQITEDGMTVFKNSNPVLKANNNGVDAVNLCASTYLIVGDKSRFENYGADRTGCFWTGG